MGLLRPSIQLTASRKHQEYPLDFKVDILLGSGEKNGEKGKKVLQAIVVHELLACLALLNSPVV